MEGVCGCGECGATSGGGGGGVPSGSSGTVATSGAMGAPSNGSKTAHSKVATGGGHANTQTSSKRSSSGADGDYQLVQHEVLYSLSAQYEKSDYDDGPVVEEDIGLVEGSIVEKGCRSYESICFNVAINTKPDED
uniref:Uncharacterized protein n=1 Tax=Anopheles coluzzii TaxID=1518534 RepID=A0A8W7P4W9_ANOCL